MNQPPTPPPRPGPTTAQIPIPESEDVQFNIRVPRNLKQAFIAAADIGGTCATEALTRFMHAYVTDATGQATLHLDGTECPISQLTTGLTRAVLARIEAREEHYGPVATIIAKQVRESIEVKP